MSASRCSITNGDSALACPPRVASTSASLPRPARVSDPPMASPSGPSAPLVTFTPRGTDGDRTGARPAVSWIPGGRPLTTGSVLARGRADDFRERCDEVAGVRPSTGKRDVGRVVVVGEQDERVVDAQLRAPLVERHAELVVEQSAEGAGAGSDPPPELGQWGVVRGLLVEHARDGSQAVVAWLWQVQRLLGHLVKLVDE